MTDRTIEGSQSRSLRIAAAVLGAIVLAAVAIFALLTLSSHAKQEEIVSELAASRFDEVSDVILPEYYFFDDVDKTAYAKEETQLKSLPEDDCDDVIDVPKYTQLSVTGENSHKYARVLYENEIRYVDASVLTEDAAEIDAMRYEDRKREIRENLDSSNVIIMGDSRMVGMQQSVKSNATFICKGSMGYQWMVNTAIPQAEARMDSNTVCIFNFGVNGLGPVDGYIKSMNAFKERHPNNIVCFMSVNPVDEAKEAQYGYSTTNSGIQSFNSKVRAGLRDIGYIDTYSYMVNNGFTTFDGLHYTADTYNSIYKYMMGNIV